jgi:SagB-type dehydrogenase family enzyme
MQGAREKNRVKLPAPKHDSPVSLEESLLKRRSLRSYTGQPLNLDQIAQMLWAAQGITARWGGRTTPSAGALYPLETYVIVGEVKGLTKGIYQYDPQRHELVRYIEGDLITHLAHAALSQAPVRDAAIDLVFTAIYQRTTRKYGERGIRYVHMEAGHAAQNVCLQAAALGLGAVTVGAFHDEGVSSLLELPNDERPLYILAIGTR